MIYAFVKFKVKGGILAFNFILINRHTIRISLSLLNLNLLYDFETKFLTFDIPFAIFDTLFLTVFKVNAYLSTSYKCIAFSSGSIASRKN